MDDFTCPSVRYLTLSVFWVSLLGIPKSLVIWVRGYPKHGDTQITVTPGTRLELRFLTEPVATNYFQQFEPIDKTFCM